MTILGIDPGIGRIGYAFLRQEKGKVSLIECGCIETDKGPEAGRLLEIKNDLTKISNKFKPEVLCIESLFFTTNAKTAMSVGQARGVVMLVAAEHKLKIIEVTPLQVKMSATGYGKADKAQVQRMIVKLLHLKKIPKLDDAADACAIAWAGIGRIKFNK